MARQKKNSKEALMAKIEKQKEEVIAARKRYDAATEQLKQSMDKLEAIEKDEIMEAFSKSDRTYEEVMAFLNGTGHDPDSDDD